MLLGSGSVDAKQREQEYVTELEQERDRLKAERNGLVNASSALRNDAQVVWARAEVAEAQRDEALALIEVDGDLLSEIAGPALANVPTEKWNRRLDMYLAILASDSAQRALKQREKEQAVIAAARAISEVIQASSSLGFVMSHQGNALADALANLDRKVPS